MSINILEESDNFINFELTSKENLNIADCFANSLRRILISDVQTLCFPYEKYKFDDKIIFEKNDSSMNNDFIAHRIGLIPINVQTVKFLVLITKHL